MAGHSKFKNIMFRKGAQDKKRAKIFSRLGKEITVSAKIGGSDPGSNIRLRSAISNAKILNMPKDNIGRAIKKGEGNDSDSNYEEIRNQVLNGNVIESIKREVGFMPKNGERLTVEEILIIENWKENGAPNN